MDKFLKTIRELKAYFHDLEPTILEGKPRNGNPGIATEEFLFLEIRSKSRKSFIRIYDPLRKTTRYKGSLVFEFYNQTTSPSYLIGEISDNATDAFGFVDFIKTLLEEHREKKDVMTTLMMHVVKQIYDKTL